MFFYIGGMNFNVVSNDPTTRLVELADSILETRKLEWNASQMRAASSVFRLGRILDAQIAERNALAKAHPDAYREARLIVARRNV